MADDDAAVRHLINVQLGALGYDVIEAADGATASELATTAEVDLVLVDIEMPDRDGYDVLAAIRASDTASTTPVVFITARTLAEEAVKALGLGANDYLRKPFDPAELQARVQAALRSKQAHDQVERRSADLEQQNRLDPLTGLYNRRHLLDQLRLLSERATASGRPMSVLMVDIDHFKAVNDGWGHGAGDQVLMAVADRLQRALRNDDVLGRWGGEEFLILLPGTEYDQALRVAECVRSTVGQPLTSTDGVLPPAVTISVGCASGAESDPAVIVSRADGALYRAKAAGRDRVIGDGPPQVLSPVPPEAASQDEATATVTAIPQGRATGDAPAATGAADAPAATAEADPTPPTAAVSAPAAPVKPDPRVTAVLSVLGGRDEAEVAAELDLGVELVRRWCTLFVAGGTDRVTGRPAPGTEEASDRYLAIIAHELMVPLTVIKGWASMLTRTQLPPEERAQAPTIIRAAAERMERTARDVLDSAAVAMGRLRLSVDDVDMGALLTDVVHSLADDHIALRTTSAAPVVAVGDRDRLSQVLYNLLSNATAHGGHGAVDVVLAGSGDQASVEVTSTGKPLDYEVARRLFEPWQRGETSTGAGIGLYVCRALVVAHGGTMGVRADGAITTFWMKIPTQGPPEGALVERKRT